MARKAASYERNFHIIAKGVKRTLKGRERGVVKDRQRGCKKLITQRCLNLKSYDYIA